MYDLDRRRARSWWASKGQGQAGGPRSRKHALDDRHEWLCSTVAERSVFS